MTNTKRSTARSERTAAELQEAWTLYQDGEVEHEKSFEVYGKRTYFIASASRTDKAAAH